MQIEIQQNSRANVCDIIHVANLNWGLVPRNSKQNVLTRYTEFNVSRKAEVQKKKCMCGLCSPTMSIISRLFRL